MSMGISKLLRKLSNVMDYTQDEFMTLFDTSDYVCSFNNGLIDVYRIDDIIGVVEEIDGNLVCTIGKLESEVQ